jgi:hypothetical protein
VGERELARVGRACDWTKQGKKRRESARIADFVFPFSKGEIVIVFIYFNRIFLELQKL